MRLRLPPCGDAAAFASAARAAYVAACGRRAPERGRMSLVPGRGGVTAEFRGVVYRVEIGGRPAPDPRCRR